MPHRIYQAVQQAHQSLQQIHEGLQQLTGMGMMGQQGGNMQFGGFTGAHSVMQPGFAGTDAQQVRQDIQNSQNGSGMNMSSFGQQGQMGMGSMGQQGQMGMSSMGQQGGSFGQMGMGQQGGGMQFGGFTGGSHSIMQPGFAGTDAQQVRQDIQNSSNGQITSRNAGSMAMNANGQQGQMGMGSMGQQGGSIGQMGMGQQGVGLQFGGFTGGSHSVMQPGFAGTDAQQVRQDIQNSSNGQITSRNAGASMGMNPNMQQGQMGMGQQGAGMQFGGFTGGPQSIMQPGFAGTDAQQVRQDIGNTSNTQGYMQ